MQSSGWLGSADRAIQRLVGAGRWLVLPVALLLFLQWPLRDFVQHYSREANDLGQWLFALYISLALTYATRQRAHLAVDAIARGYRARLRDAIGRWGTLLCVAPWAVFIIAAVWPCCWLCWRWRRPRSTRRGRGARPDAWRRRACGCCWPSLRRCWQPACRPTPSCSASRRSSPRLASCGASSMAGC